MRFETTDKIALVIAAVLVIGGFLTLLHPQELTFGRATNFLKSRQETLIEHITPRQSRLYGLLTVLGGCGLVTYVIWAARSS